jgi:hypothetical protein
MVHRELWSLPILCQFHVELELPQSSPSVLPHRSLLWPKASKKLLVANTPSLPQCGELFQPFPEVSFLSLQHTGRRERRGEGTPALHSRSGSGASRAAGKFCAAASSIPSSDNLVGCCSRRSKRRRAFGMCVTSPVRARACVLLFHLGDSLQSLLCVSLASRV